MTIIYRAPVQSLGQERVATVRIVGDEDIALFQRLVNRALGTWDNAPAQIKEFGDMVTEGKILQDYQAHAK